MKTRNGIAPFEKWSKEYEWWFNEYSNVYESEVVAIRAALPVGGEGLEIGVGTGRFAPRLGVRIGIDPAAPMLALAQTRGVQAVQALGEQLPFRDGSFDFVLMVTVICFLDDVPAVFAEARRVLRPGGRLIVGFLDRTVPEGRKLEKYRTKSDFFWAADFYSPEEVQTFLKKSGFGEAEWTQSVCGQVDRIFEVQSPLKGSGEGLFVVASAQVV